MLAKWAPALKIKSVLAIQLSALNFTALVFFFTAINATYGSIFIGIKPTQSYGFFKPFINRVLAYLAGKEMQGCSIFYIGFQVLHVAF